MINSIEHRLNRVLSKNYKWLFNTYDVTVLIKNKQLIFFSIRFFASFQKNWKETKKLMEQTKEVIEKCKQEMRIMVVDDDKIKKEIELGLINIIWFEKK